MGADSKSYQAWGIETEILFDDEGNETEGPEYALIEKIYVPESDRGAGVGSELLSEAIAEIRSEHGDIDIKLAALPFGKKAMDMGDLVEWYEKRGFGVESAEGHAVIMSYEM